MVATRRFNLEITQSVRGYFEGHPGLKYIFFGGKGGCGQDGPGRRNRPLVGQAGPTDPSGIHQPGP